MGVGVGVVVGVGVGVWVGAELPSQFEYLNTPNTKQNYHTVDYVLCRVPIDLG